VPIDDTAWQALDPGQRRQRTLDAVKRLFLREAREQARVSAHLGQQAAHERLQTSRQAYIRSTDGKLHGKPGNGIDSKYQMTGLVVCGWCGGPSPPARAPRVGTGRSSTTAWPTSSGDLASVQMDVGLPMRAIDDLVLGMFERQLLDPAVIEASIAEAVSRLQADTDADTERARLMKQIQDTDDELRNLAVAIATTGAIPALVTVAQERER
jgi:hypothetical protein